MRFTAAGITLAALTLVAPSYAQRYGESTWTWQGNTWTAALDSNGNPMNPSLASSPSAVWTETRTRYGANGRTTIEVGYDDDDDPVATSTLGHSSPSLFTPTPSSTPFSSTSSSSSQTFFTTSFGLDQLMSISGYWPPRTSIIASPTYSSGSIININEIPGYRGAVATSTTSNGRPVYGGTKVYKRALPTADIAERGPPGRRSLS